MRLEYRKSVLQLTKCDTKLNKPNQYTFVCHYAIHVIIGYINWGLPHSSIGEYTPIITKFFMNQLRIGKDLG